MRETNDSKKEEVHEIDFNDPLFPKNASILI